MICSDMISYDEDDIATMVVDVVLSLVDIAVGVAALQQQERV